MKAKESLETLAEYDAGLIKDMKLPAVATRPVGSVVQTVTD
jgi:peptidoglycan-N-acetylglucosamine deacetylase